MSVERNVLYIYFSLYACYSIVLTSSHHCTMCTTDRNYACTMHICHIIYAVSPEKALYFQPTSCIIPIRIIQSIALGFVMQYDKLRSNITGIPEKEVSYPNPSMIKHF